MSSSKTHIQLYLKTGQDLLLTPKATNDDLLDHIDKKYKKYKEYAPSIEYNEPLSKYDFGSLVSFDITQFGDGVVACYLDIEMPVVDKVDGTFAGWTNSVGFAIIEYVDLYIGEKRLINRLYPEYLLLDYELNKDGNSLDASIGRLDSYSSYIINSNKSRKYSVPLNLLFDDTNENVLFTHSLNDSIRIDIKLRNVRDLIIYDGNIEPNISGNLKLNITSKHIYINNTDRINKKKENTNNELFLFRQIGFNNTYDITNDKKFMRIKLSFNLPVEEIFIVARDKNSVENTDYFNFSKRNTDPLSVSASFISKMGLIIDGQYRIPTRPEEFFRINTVRKYHKNITGKYVYCMPFNLHGDTYQPSGSINLSASNSAEIYFEFDPTVLSGTSAEILIFSKALNFYTINKYGHFVVKYEN